MKKVLLCFCIVICCSSCKGIADHPMRSVTVPSDSYYAADITFSISEHNIYDEGKTVFQITDELQLALLLQYRYEQQEDTTSYQCEKELDLEQVSQYLSHVNPFDLHLMQTMNEYYDQDQKLVYRLYDIKLEHLDPFYEDSLAYAQAVLEEIISAHMTVDQKIKAVHDYLIYHITYDNAAAVMEPQQSNAFSAYGALFEQRAVCTGYARSFMILMQLLDIPVIYVSSDIMGHSWNMVRSDTGWRYLDITWDDHDNAQLDTTYFLKTEQEFYADGKHEQDAVRGASYDLSLAENFFPM